MGADQPADHGSLGLTQLRELRGDVRDRAMVLTELAAAGQARGRGGVTLAGQRPRQSLRPGEAVGPGGRDSLGTALLESAELFLRERGDRLGASAASEVPQGGHRQVVVGMREALPARAGEGEHPSGTSATAAGLVRRRVSLDSSLDLECVEVPADRGRGDTEFGAEISRTQRALAPEQVDHPVTGTTVVGPGSADVRPNRGVLLRGGQNGGFHYNIVTYLAGGFHQGSPNLTWRCSLVVPAYAEQMPAQLAESVGRPPTTALFGVPLGRITLINLGAQISIVLTGGVVRLTGSGLGCPSFPTCTDEDFFPTPELEINGIIEFANRALSGVVGLIAVLTVYAVWRARRRDLLPTALGVLLGVPAQALLGGLTVLTGLNPWSVAAHFLVSMALIAVATRLHLRTSTPSLERAALSGPRRWLIVAIAVDLAVVLVLGTVTTGSGPHSGDPAAGRTGLDVAIMSRLHAESVYLLIGLTILAVLLTRDGPSTVHRAAWWVLAAEVVQAVIGITQYFTDLPRLLVSAHMLGAALMVVATARLWYLGLGRRGDRVNPWWARSSRPVAR